MVVLADGTEECNPWEPVYLGEVSGTLRTNICRALSLCQSLYCMLYMRVLISISCEGGAIVTSLRTKKLRVRAIG